MLKMSLLCIQLWAFPFYFIAARDLSPLLPLFAPEPRHDFHVPTNNRIIMFAFFYNRVIPLPTAPNIFILQFFKYDFRSSPANIRLMGRRGARNKKLSTECVGEQKMTFRYSSEMPSTRTNIIYREKGKMYISIIAILKIVMGETYRKAFASYYNHCFAFLFVLVGSTIASFLCCVSYFHISFCVS